MEVTKELFVQPSSRDSFSNKQEEVLEESYISLISDDKDKILLFCWWRFNILYWTGRTEGRWVVSRCLSVMWPSTILY